VRDRSGANESIIAKRWQSTDTGCFRNCKIQTRVVGDGFGRRTQNLGRQVYRWRRAHNRAVQPVVAQAKESRIPMSAILPQLVLLAAGDSIAPPLLLLNILFLGSQSPLPNATALALGYLATFTTMGVVGPIVFSEPAGAEGATSVVRRVISATIGGLLIALDFRSLLKIPDPDARPSRWIESTSSLSPPRTFGYGMALCPSQIKNLAIFVACLKLIAAASLGLLPSRQHRGARAGALRLRHTGSCTHRPLRTHTTRCLDHAGVLAGMDGEEQSRDHGRALLRVRSVLPDQKPLGTPRAWALVPGLRCARST
jgi:hypothetical protein